MHTGSRDNIVSLFHVAGDDFHVQPRSVCKKLKFSMFIYVYAQEFQATSVHV